MSSQENPKSNLGKLTLVIGVDGSGKSAFLKCMSQLDNIVTLEPTDTTEAKEFKQKSLNEIIDENFINQHNELFLRLNKEFDQKTFEKRNMGIDVAISGGVLITFVAHSLMRNIINKKSESVDETVTKWVESDDFIKPDELVFLYAPDEVIIQRIKKRQLKGREEEKFWGFNSPFFLARYQEIWHTVVDKLAKEAIADCITIDTSVYSREDTFDKYLKNRKIKSDNPFKNPDNVL